MEIVIRRDFSTRQLKNKAFLILITGLLYSLVSMVSLLLIATSDDDYEIGSAPDVVCTSILSKIALSGAFFGAIVLTLLITSPKTLRISLICYGIFYLLTLLWHCYVCASFLIIVGGNNRKNATAFLAQLFVALESSLTISSTFPLVGVLIYKLYKTSSKMTVGMPNTRRVATSPIETATSASPKVTSDRINKKTVGNLGIHTLNVVPEKEQQELFKQVKLDNRVCGIGIEDFTDKNDIISLPCSETHVFHFGCIGKWTSIDPYCPACRKQIPKSTIRKIDETLVKRTAECLVL